MKKLLFVLFCCFGFIGCAQTHQESMLFLHNKARNHLFMRSLKMDSHLEQAAGLHARWMASENILSHEEDHIMHEPWDRARACGAKYPMIGENILYQSGFDNIEEAFDDWMNSSGHRANILNPHYKFVGFGKAISKKDGTVYWCAVFGGFDE